MRPNQKRRTRKDLLQAAATLMKQGRRPSLDEVAEEALVSRATAYRYFPSIEALLAEASADMLTPEPAQLFTGDEPTDPVARVEKVERPVVRVRCRASSSIQPIISTARLVASCTTAGTRPAPSRFSRAAIAGSSELTHPVSQGAPRHRPREAWATHEAWRRA